MIGDGDFIHVDGPSNTLGKNFSLLIKTPSSQLGRVHKTLPIQEVAAIDVCKSPIIK